MSQLPHIEFEPVSHAEQALLAAWLTEYRVDLALRSADMDEDSTQGRLADSGEPGNQLPADDGLEAGPLGAGMIRLMHPGLPGASTRLYHLAILTEISPESRLCVSFSPYTTPATPGELGTGIADAGLRVISLWNAYVLPDSMIRQSWSAGHLPVDLLARCLELLDAVPDSWLCAPRTLDTQGPRVVHSLDPRHDYLAEERAIAEGLRPEVSQREEEGESRGRVIEYPDASSDELLAAAEEDAPYGMVATYAVEDSPLLINFWIGSRTMLLVRVIDKQERPSADLDGYRLLGPRGIVSPRIATGCLSLPRTYLRDDVGLQTPDGEILKLTRLA